MTSGKPRLLFFVTEDWFFLSHFLPRALAAREAGYDVFVLTRLGKDGDRIRSCGLNVLPVAVERHGVNPFRELRTVLAVWRAYRHTRPDIVHQLGLKPVLYGSLAARLAGVWRIVNAPVGMGFVFTSESPLARVLRPVVKLGLRILMNPRGSRVVFENSDDLGSSVAEGIVRASEAVLIRGAGVDLDRFRPLPEPAGTPVVALVARMLWDKGVGELVEAARLLKRRSVAARFLLVGAPDSGNPSAVPVPLLESWQAEGVVQWLGQRDDVAAILAGSHVACLPSYREGLPKALLEALAAGRPVVTTDVPGCREAVIDGDNGFLVPPRDPVALADALEKLVADPDLRRRFGVRSRALAEAEFGTAKVDEATLAVYRDLLAASRSGRVREWKAGDWAASAGPAEQSAAVAFGVAHPRIARESGRSASSPVRDAKPVRVLHVYRTYFPDPPGGLQEAIRQMSRAVRQFGGEARVFTLTPNPLPAIVEDAGVPVFRARSWAAPASCDLGDAGSFRMFAEQARWADVIHYHFPWPFADVLNLVVRPDRPKVMTYHSDIVRQRFLSALYGPLMVHTIRDMDAVVATSPAYADTSPVLSRRVEDSRLRMIPLGIEDLRPGASLDGPPPELFSRIGVFDQPYVLFIGVLRYYKGLHNLVRAAPSIPAKIVIAGEGPESERLVGLARKVRADNVVFTGQVSEQEKLALLARCAALVLPSQYRSEAFGMVLVEASMLSRPLVCCEVGSGTSFVNVHGETGFVVPPNDSPALADAVNRLLSDPALASRMGVAARARYEQLFSGEALGKAYMALYREVLWR